MVKSSNMLKKASCNLSDLHLQGQASRLSATMHAALQVCRWCLTFSRGVLCQAHALLNHISSASGGTQRAYDEARWIS